MRWKLSWPVVALTALPLAVSWFVYPSHVPPHFGEFPPQFVQQDPPFLWWYFLLLAAVVLTIIAVYALPPLFGIKGEPPLPPTSSSSHFPPWFWIGGLVMLISWWLMWARPESLRSIVPFAFSPLWWGFIFMMDGIVYRRTGGKSLFATRRSFFLITAVVSLVGWLFFEYFDYFVLGNWYYPQVDVLPHEITVIVFLVAYTTVWPAVFEWYTLLDSYPSFVARFKGGPRITFDGKRMMGLGFALMVLMVIWPLPFFWAVWIAPMLVFSGLLINLRIWNPFQALSEGNWAPILLIAVACILNGFIWEAWNYGSTHPAEPVMNPNYWRYDIPYANIIHIYSEMPLLGYFGYMPFGILVWQFSIWCGKLFGFDSSLDLNGVDAPPGRNGT